MPVVLYVGSWSGRDFDAGGRFFITDQCTPCELTSGSGPVVGSVSSISFLAGCEVAIDKPLSRV
jgi:hypothetical protein